MTIGFIFWFIMLLVLLLGGYWGWRSDRSSGFVSFAPVGMSFILFILLFLLGVRVFGWPISGG